MASPLMENILVKKSVFCLHFVFCIFIFIILTIYTSIDMFCWASREITQSPEATLDDVWFSIMILSASTTLN